MDETQAAETEVEETREEESGDPAEEEEAEPVETAEEEVLPAEEPEAEPETEEESPLYPDAAEAEQDYVKAFEKAVYQKPENADADAPEIKF